MTNEVITPDGSSQTWPGGRLSLLKLGKLLRISNLDARRMPRFVNRLAVTEDDYFIRPPIITNSFVRSGIDLLLRIANAFPGIRHYGNFIASMPTIPFRERTAATHDRLIRRIVPGEALGAQIFYDKTHARRIEARNGAHFFIYRDLREVAVEEAYYLTHVNFWHRLHPFYLRLGNDADRISAAILGFSHERFPYHYPNIAQRFARYEGWLDRPDVMPIAYEELCSNRLNETVRRMVRFYAARCRTAVDEDRIVGTVRTAMASHRLQVSRCDHSTPWVTAFTDDHYRQFEEVAGALNRRLGYT